MLEWSLESDRIVQHSYPLSWLDWLEMTMTLCAVFLFVCSPLYTTTGMCCDQVSYNLLFLYSPDDFYMNWICNKSHKCIHIQHTYLYSNIYSLVDDGDVFSDHFFCAQPIASHCIIKLTTTPTSTTTEDEGRE